MRTNPRQRGVTLIELLVVVAIIGVIAAIAVPAYTKWVNKGKASEIPGMLGQFQQREEQYRAENGSYLATGADDDDYFPKPLTGGGSLTGLTAKPATWTTLRIDPGREALYCGYVVITGEGGTAAAGDAADLWEATPTKDWFYVRAECDWDGDSATNNIWYVRGDLTVSTAIQENEGR